MAIKGITVSVEAYQAMAKVKRKGQSFSQLILETFGPRPVTCGELLDELEKSFEGARITSVKRLEKLRAGRGRRSNRRS